MENQEFWLEVIKGKSRGQTFRLLSDVITVGRRLTAKERKINWLLLDEPSLSRIHAVLQWNDEIQSFELFHKSSARPTLVNNKKVDQAALSSQDKIQMGDIVFRFWEGPIEKKFDYYLNEEAHEDESSTPPVKQSFTPLDVQREYQKKAKSQEDSEETSGYGLESTETAMLHEAAIREERKIVKAVEREAQKVQEFKPLVFTQFNESDKEEAPAKEKVFYSQKGHKKDSSEFTPLKFSSEKPSSAPPERESPLKKTSKVEQYLNGRGGKASPATIKPVNLIKDMSAPPAQKGGKLLGASEERSESAASFTPVSFSREEKREPVEDPRETRLMLNKQSGGSSGDAPASFKPVSLIQPRAVIDSQSYKGRGKILGSQNKEEDETEESELSSQTFQESRNGGSPYLSSTRMIEEASRYSEEENGKESRQDSVKTFNLLKSQSQKISSQSYGEAATGSTVENKEEQLPALIHDEALDGDSQFFDGMGEIPLPPLDEAIATKENEQPSPGYRPLRIRSKTQVRYSGWNKELSSRERNAAKALSESETKPVRPAAGGSEIKQAEPVSPAEAEAVIPSHQDEEPLDNEPGGEYTSTTLTPPLDLIDYNEGAVSAEDTIIPEKQSEESFEMLIEASLQPPLQLEEAPPTRLLSRRNPQHPADGGTVPQIPTGEMLQPHLLPPDTPRPTAQPLKQLFRSKAPQSHETPEQTAQPPSPQSMENVQQPMEPPTLFSSGEVQKPMEPPTLFSSDEMQKPMESPTLFSSGEVQKPMESPTLFSYSEVQQPTEPPAIFSSEAIEQIWTTLVPERMQQQSISNPAQPWTPQVTDRAQQPVQSLGELSLEMPELSWTPTIPEIAKEPLQPPVYFHSELPELSLTPVAPENTEDPLQPTLQLSLEMSDLPWTPQTPESVQNQLQPPLQHSAETPYPSEGAPTRLLSQKKKKELETDNREQTNKLMAPWDKKAHIVEKPQSLTDERRARSNGGRLRAPWEKALAKKREEEEARKAGDIPLPPPYLNRPAAVFNRSTEKESKNAGKKPADDTPRAIRHLGRDNKHPEGTKSVDKSASPLRAESAPQGKPERTAAAQQFLRAIPSEETAVKAGTTQEEPVLHKKAGPKAVTPQEIELAPPWEAVHPASPVKGMEQAPPQKAVYRSPEPQGTEAAPPWEAVRPVLPLQGPKNAPSQKIRKSPAARQEIELAPSWDNVLPASSVQRAKQAPPQKAEQPPVLPKGTEAVPPDIRTAGSSSPENDEPIQKSRKPYTRTENMQNLPQQIQPRGDFSPYNIASTEVMEFFLDKESNGTVKPAAAVPSVNVPYDSFKARMNRQMEERRVQGQAIPSQTVQDESEKSVEAVKDDGRHLFHSWKPPQDLQPDEISTAPPGKAGVPRSPASPQTSPQMKKAEQNQLQAEPCEILLIQSSSEEEGKCYPINKSSITIGKSEENDIVVHDTQLAPVHLKIYCEGTTFFLQKMEKTQPVFINGKILATSSGKLIMDGDLIQISGKTKLVFKKKRT
ncbi:MAG: FHA domain-containing protein [Vulcanimicrobiota bacterium]